MQVHVPNIQVTGTKSHEQKWQMCKWYDFDLKTILFEMQIAQNTIHNMHTFMAPIKHKRIETILYFHYKLMLLSLSH